MGKTARIKGDLDDVEALLEIINVLKDVSTNRFFAFAQRKADFAKFLEIFLIFFNMLESTDTSCPLVRNNNPGTDLLMISSEMAFMSQLNSRVCSATVAESKKFPSAQIVVVGFRGEEKLRSMGVNPHKVYRDLDNWDHYELALQIRDFLIDRIMTGASGRCLCIYIWPKSFNILKPRVITLLPAEELLGGADEGSGEGGAKKQTRFRYQGRDFIAESRIDGIMKVLADIWVSSRLFEVLSDTKLAEAASQAQQLEQAIEGLNKEKKELTVAFKKSGRDDLNKAMREVFSASSVVKRR
jgi:F0F1-type ATP synthase gamma subunit